jgi:hypothetical protein
MVAAVRAAVPPCQLYPVAFDLIDGAELGAVRANDVHMGGDLSQVRHVFAPSVMGRRENDVA